MCGAGLWAVALAATAASRYEPLPIESRESNPTSPYLDQPAAYQEQQGESGSVNQPVVSPDVQWELYNQLQLLQEEVNRLRGIVEEQQYQIEQMRAQQRDRYIDLDQRITQLKASLAKPDAPATPVTSEDSGSVAIQDEKAAYDQAMQLLKSKKFKQSIERFEALLKASPQGEYAPYAHYWLGELYMAITPPQYDVAKEHFVKLLSKYKGHSKEPDGLYKLGKLFYLTGAKDRARVMLQKVIQEHPGTPAARFSRDLLTKF